MNKDLYITILLPICILLTLGYIAYELPNPLTMTIPCLWYLFIVKMQYKVNGFWSTVIWPLLYLFGLISYLGGVGFGLCLGLWRLAFSETKQ
jgi:hypothetical protein